MTGRGRSERMDLMRSTLISMGVAAHVRIMVAEGLLRYDEVQDVVTSLCEECRQLLLDNEKELRRRLAENN